MNLFLNLPAPSANGAGAAVDVSGMGQLKTIVLGGTFDAQVTVEYATDDTGTNFAAIAGFGGPGHKTVEVAARWMRAVVSGYRSGAINVDVGASNAGCEFVEVTGVSASIASLPPFKTVVVDGGFSGAVNIEVSEDGTSWAQVMTFLKAGGQSATIIGQFVRATGGGGSLPAIWMGAGNDGSPGTGPSPYPDPQVEVNYYARITGSDTTGDGSLTNPVRTFEKLVTLPPSLLLPRNTIYNLDYTGIEQNPLADGFELPQWKAPAGFWYDDTDPYFPVKSAINLKADPKITTSLSAANAVIAEADLVPTDITGGPALADVSGFNDVRNSGSGDGVADAITDEGAGVAKLTIGGEEFESDATFITIAGSANPANDGTFPVVNVDGDQIYYDNPAVVAEPAFAGTYESFIPYVLIETAAPHGLWQTDLTIQNVTFAGVDGTIAADVNGEHTVTWRTPTTFIFQTDDPDVTTKVWGGNGTASVLFVQDPASGNVELRTTKNFGANDSLVGQLLISGFNEFWNAVIWKNTADTLYLTQCFGPGSLGTPILDMTVMEQSAELLTTCTFAGAGARRGAHRGGLTIANVDSISLGGTKITPVTPGEIGLLQEGGTLVTQLCHLTTSRFNSAQDAAMLQCSYIDDALFKGSAVDLERCYFRNIPDTYLNGTVGWFYAYFGTVFNNVTIGFDTNAESDLFACKFHDQETAGLFYQGRNTWANVSGENIEGIFVEASGSASRNRMIRCQASMVNPYAMVLAFNGGTFLINSDDGPYGDASFTGVGDDMAVDGLPARTFDDFRQKALLDLTPLTANFDTVFEARWGFTSSPRPTDPVYPSISVTGRAPDAGGVIVTYNAGTGVVDISYETAVSTVLDAETAVDAFAWPDDGGIVTKTPGTAANVLTSPGDDLVATLLDVGVNGPCGEYTNIRANPKTDLLDCPGSLGTQSTILAYNLSGTNGAK